jgi:KipI family sensor histidine kinase inhibitor
MTSPVPAPLAFSALGEAAVLFDAAQGPLDFAVQQRIWALSSLLAAAHGVVETVPGMNNLLVVFDPFLTDHRTLVDAARANWPPAVPSETPGKAVEIPVVYGGRYGEDLAWMAQRAGMSAEAFARLHASATYTVYALGGQPGFAFLGGLDARLATPRQDVPRVHVPAGTVMIGGEQTGIYPADAPSGWNLIGHTSMTLFDPTRTPPALLSPGDTVRMIVEDVLP